MPKSKKHYLTIINPKIKQTLFVQYLSLFSKTIMNIFFSFRPFVTRTAPKPYIPKYSTHSTQVLNISVLITPLSKFSSHYLLLLNSLPQVFIFPFDHLFISSIYFLFFVLGKNFYFCSFVLLIFYILIFRTSIYLRWIFLYCCYMSSYSRSRHRQNSK